MLTPAREWQMMGKTSGSSKYNLPGRGAWFAAEIVGPLNLLYILYTLPKTHAVQPHSSTSFLGTGLPAQHEFLGLLYVLHYINRAVVAPLFLAPSMSPIHPLITFLMTTFQFVNSGNIACWLAYSARDGKGLQGSFTSPLALVGLLAFFAGLIGNIHAENTLYSLRKASAKRKAKSEGKAQITYDKVYVIPSAEGVFRYILFPHYVLEWMEWTGYWILAGALGLGWGNKSAALWFIINEVLSMAPRAFTGKQWYEKKFGKRAVAGRAGAIPFLGL
jgi:3-oxo-5-alpha-steroid 4-dehydrogenase 1